jgi:hypothetical protein
MIQFRFVFFHCLLLKNLRINISKIVLHVPAFLVYSLYVFLYACETWSVTLREEILEHFFHACCMFLARSCGSERPLFNHIQIYIIYLSSSFSKTCTLS